jgi:hypothetical protein
MSLTAFEKSVSTWNLIWSEFYVPHLNLTQPDSQFKHISVKAYWQI